MLSKPLGGSFSYGNDVRFGTSFFVDAVAEEVAGGMALELPCDRALGDVDDIVLEPPPVREPRGVAAEEAQPVRGRRRRDREVDPKHVGGFGPCGSGRAPDPVAAELADLRPRPLRHRPDADGVVGVVQALGSDVTPRR